jgi:hypothetical protein
MEYKESGRTKCCMRAAAEQWMKLRKIAKVGENSKLGEIS